MWAAEISRSDGYAGQMRMAPWHLLAVIVAGWMSRQQQQVIEYLREENRVLREKLGKKRVLLHDDQRRRLAAKAKVLGRRMLEEVFSIVMPDTLLRWHNRLIARKYDGGDKRRKGRPDVMQRIRELAEQMAEENKSWGYRRIQGALANLGHRVGRSTVRRILKEHGIDPAPERRKHLPWKTFLRAHWGAIAAADFFTVEIWTRTGLTRYFVFFVMDLATRKIEVAGITAAPSGVWMTQIARNLTDVANGFLSDHRYLICDRDPLYIYTREFRETLRAAGVTPVRLPPRSPDLNAYAERFVRSIKSECLDRLIIIGERHLRMAISEYVGHYHAERNHQGLENALIAPASEVGELSGPVLRRERLGGMLNYYHRKAA